MVSFSDKQLSCVEPVDTGQKYMKDASDVVAKSRSDWSEWDDTSASHVEDNVLVNSECIHNENGDKLESSVTSGDRSGHQLRKSISDKSVKCDNSSSRALKLQSEKIQTSPPPHSKVNSSSAVVQKEFESSPKQIREEYVPCGQLSVQSASTWDAAGEDNQWNSDNWQDIDSVTEDEYMKITETHSIDLSLAEQSDGMTLQSSKKSSSAENTIGLASNRLASHQRTADVDITSLDIKTLPIKVSKEPEIDFFADMQPNIKVDGSNLWGVLSDNKTDSKRPQDHSANQRKDTNHGTISFAAVEVIENEVMYYHQVVSICDYLLAVVKYNEM